MPIVVGSFLNPPAIHPGFPRIAVTANLEYQAEEQDQEQTEDVQLLLGRVLVDLDHRASVPSPGRTA